ncbi:TonB-dependent receptor [Luteitalea sp.]|uniref:TonB-dependent receptor n=1 Tax=Luteitalea sp. TaxID=2004800 RepID=UPI0025B81A00|nr:TonB-dependent receptor [Luteitalea sp.]
MLPPSRCAARLATRLAAPMCPCLVLLALAGSPAYAQPQPPAAATTPADSRPVLAGRVVDPTGAVIAAATVEVERDGRRARLRTDGAGRFLFADQPPGTVVVVASAPGFTDDARSVDLPSAEAATLVFTLQPAGVRDDVVVTAMRVATPTSSLPHTVTIVDRARIEDRIAASDDLASLLEQTVPGFSPSLKKMTGRSESLRGREPLYTVNGVSQATPLRDGSRDGHSIDIDFLERVEVVHGSNALQGIGATGGTVNMVTRGPNADGSLLNEVRLGTSMHDSFDGDTSGSKLSWLLGKRVGTIDVVGGIAFNKRGMFHDASGTPVGLYPTQGDIMDSTSRSVYGKVGVDLGRQQRIEFLVNDFRLERDGDFLPVIGQRSTGRLGTSAPGDPRPLVGDPARNHTTMATLEYRHTQLAGGEAVAQAYWQQSSFLFEGGAFTTFALTTGGPAFLDQSAIESDKLGLKLTWTVPGARLFGIRTTTGLDVTQDATSQILARTNRAWVPEARLNEVSPFVQAQRAIGPRLLLTGGARFEYARLVVDDYTTLPSNNAVLVRGGAPSFTNVLPNVGAVLTLGAGWSTYTSLSQGFTMPDAGRVLRDVRLPGRDIDSLLDLQPIVVDNREVGVDYQSGRVRAHLAYYQSHSDLGAILVATPEQVFNVRRQPTTTSGVDATMEATLHERITLGGTFAWQRGRFDSDLDGRDDTDLDGLNIGPNRLNLFGTARLSRHVSARLQVSTLGERTFSGLTASRARFGGYTTADALVGITTRLGVVRLGIENLLDRQYVTYFSQVDPLQANDTFFAGPGRTLSVSLQRRF